MMKVVQSEFHPVQAPKLQGNLVWGAGWGDKNKTKHQTNKKAVLSSWSGLMENSYMCIQIYIHSVQLFTYVQLGIKSDQSI